ncbi:MULTISPECIES: prepilin-type N-terminal cleavage/methylation domain-containing protein [unclassified Cryobacterium]|uniref:type IV pilus modification PilV family protein n=1 Tax=unclassified Cryobacterium TaxID=2649013 RepID=UPI00106B788E|nr:MULTISPECIES: type II secretion system protein [unclassified Cryobacterium]TFC56941.1 type II secretion system protein [Cryobacterium sp. TMB3-1-2]TFC67898.1 type II secretion system protein [Cryobacterium sp. TMB3-15]TFC76817.1 type II secretion system protein [Cryobacterium sp. TMB3-10]TFD42234.1 type II secretion system protein [Cryobacterium sp. TMB3-12]
MILPTPANRPKADDRGFGMIEIVVSMFLIALIAMAFIPVLVQGMRLSVVNTSVATATQLVSQNMEQARARGTNCADLRTFAAEAISPVVDKRGVSFQPTRDPITCTGTIADYPKTVPFQVKVTESGSSAVLASASTLILVKWVP